MITLPRKPVFQGPSPPSSPGFPPYCQASSPRPRDTTRCKQGNLTPGKCPLTEQAVHEKPRPGAVTSRSRGKGSPSIRQRFFDIPDIRSQFFRNRGSDLQGMSSPGIDQYCYAIHTVPCWCRDLLLGIIPEIRLRVFPGCTVENSRVKIRLKNFRIVKVNAGIVSIRTLISSYAEKRARNLHAPTGLHVSEFPFPGEMARPVLLPASRKLPPSR